MINTRLKKSIDMNNGSVLFKLNADNINYNIFFQIY